MNIDKLLRETLIDYALKQRDFDRVKEYAAMPEQANKRMRDNDAFDFDVMDLDEIMWLQENDCALVFDGYELSGHPEAFYLAFVDDPSVGKGIVVKAAQYTRVDATTRRRVISRRKLYDLVRFSDMCGLSK